MDSTRLILQTECPCGLGRLRPPGYKPPPPLIHSKIPNIQMPIYAGGLLFIGACNTHGDQLFRGAELYAVNATTGKLVWSETSFIRWDYIKLSGMRGRLPGRSQRLRQPIYCFGKGQTATTVSAPTFVVPQGNTSADSGHSH